MELKKNLISVFDYCIKMFTVCMIFKTLKISFWIVEILLPLICITNGRLKMTNNDNNDHKYV
jgi:hypothetical protein